VHFAKDNGLIEAFAAERANQAFGMTVLPGRARANRPVADTCVCRKLDSAILTIKTAENRSGCDCADALNDPMNGSIQV
jgi:hypothetical protein